MNLTSKDLARIEEIEPVLSSLYKKAGYERAIALQSQIEELTKKSIFDIEDIAIEAANCFHSGTWAVWNGDGVSEMESMLEGGYYNDVDSLIEAYKGNAPYVELFVRVAEEYLRGLAK